jgi:two-component system CheB/CheR fusion protein
MAKTPRESIPARKGKAGRKKDLSEEEMGQRIADLETELQKVTDSYQTTVEEMISSNEELKSTNEELQSTNEELQSTNEELETSREELQSVNEELGAVNAEHQEKIEILQTMASDIDNLMASTDMATIFLDNDLLVKRYTPSSAKVANLIATDLGRPLGDLAFKLNDKDIMGGVESVLKTLTPFETEIQDFDGNWFFMRILPYRTINNVIDGVVLTFADINLQKEAIQTREVVETVSVPIIILDEDFHVSYANKAFYDTFKVKSYNTEGRTIYELGDGQWEIPGLHELLERILPQKSHIKGFEVKHTFPDIGERTFILNARQVQGTRKLILLVIEDMTPRN